MKKFLLIFLCGVLNACAFGGPKIMPEVNVADLRFGQVTVFETTAYFTLRIQNPNDEELIVKGATYDLSLNGIRIGKGLSNEQVTVPRLGSAMQRVEVSISNVNILTRIQELVNAPQVDYKVDAVLYVPGILGSTAVKMSDEGKVTYFKSGRQ